MRAIITYLFTVTLLLSAKAPLSATAIDLGTIELGALPVGRETPFSITVPYAGPELLVAEIASSCPCLQINESPGEIAAGEYKLGFTIKPLEEGPATVQLEWEVFSTDSGEVGTMTTPVSVVGFDDSAPPEFPEWLATVTPDQAYRRLGSYRVIDIRGEAAYRKAHIPGSLEYSLDMLVARTGMFNRTVLLVGDGLLGSREATLLRELESQAARVLWLAGGLPAWIRSGMPTAGVWPVATQVALVSVDRWFESSRASADRWVVVDFSQTLNESGRFFGLDVVRPGSFDNGAVEESMLLAMEAILRLPETGAVLVVGDANELVYPLAESVARRHSALPVYYLKNGDQGYRRWIASRAGQPNNGIQRVSSSTSRQLSGAFRNSRTAGHSGCSSCPGRH